MRPFPERRGQAMPHRAMWGSTSVGQEADAGTRGKPRSDLLLGLLQKGLGRAGQTLGYSFRIG